MDLFHLEYFCTVALTQNISEAARRHYISQPAMSKYMSHIERELQAPLFIRNGNQIRLSTEGERFYTYAKRVVASYQDGLNALHEGQNRLAINIQINTTRHMFLPYAKEYLASHPMVDLRVDLNYRREALEGNEVSNMYHFSVGSKCHHHYLNKSVPLFSERLVLSVPANHRLADRKSVSVLELQNEPFVMQSKNQNYARALVQTCRDNGFEPQIRLLCNETKYLCNMVACGIGLSLVPEFSWRDMLDPSVRLVRIEELPDVHTHALHWNENRFYSKDMIEFREGLIKFYRNLISEQGDRPSPIMPEST